MAYYPVIVGLMERLVVMELVGMATSQEEGEVHWVALVDMEEQAQLVQMVKLMVKMAEMVEMPERVA